MLTAVNQGLFVRFLRHLRSWSAMAIMPLTDSTNIATFMSDFRITMKLEAGKEYRFRYLIDGSRWENDWSADRYVPNRYGTDDSLVIL